MNAATQLRLAGLLDSSGCEVVRAQRVPGSANISSYQKVEWATVIGMLMTRGLVVREANTNSNDPCQLRLVTDDREAS